MTHSNPRKVPDLTVKAVWSRDREWGSVTVGHSALGVEADSSFVHYGQSVFEGLRAFLTVSGDICLYRPRDHHSRLCSSARRMCLPEPPYDLFLDALTRYVLLNVPALREPGDSIYLRPVLVATTKSLGIARPLADAMLFVTGLANFNHMGGDNGLSVAVEREYRRAWPNGVGAVKCSGNYGLARLGQARAADQGCDDALWLSHDLHIAELSSMNIFAILDNELVTPPADDGILPGITRSAILRIAEQFSMAVNVRPIHVDDLTDGLSSGRISEVFATGTASGVVRIRELVDSERQYTIPSGGHVAEHLHREMAGIQAGRNVDFDGWLTPIHRCVDVGVPRPGSRPGVTSSYDVYGYEMAASGHLHLASLVRIAQRSAADYLVGLTSQGLDQGRFGWVLRRNVVRGWSATPWTFHVSSSFEVRAFGSCWFEAETRFVSGRETLPCVIKAFWVYLDLETQRPAPIPEEFGKILEAEGVDDELMWRSALRGRPTPAPTALIDSGRSVARGVRLSDHDAFGHVNNAVYFDFVDHIAQDANEITVEYEQQIGREVSEVHVTDTPSAATETIFWVHNPAAKAVFAKGLVRYR